MYIIPLETTQNSKTYFLFVGFQVLTAATMRMAVFGLLRRVVWQKFTDVSEVLAASIIRTIALAQQPRRQPSS
jgi:hypothetical protein